MGAILLAFLAAGASAVLSAWGLMLLVGIAHLNWWPAIPTMSFSTAFTLCAVASGIVLVRALVLQAAEEAVS